MPVLGDRAVVLGASMGGLLAARVLADFFRTVTGLLDSPPRLLHPAFLYRVARVNLQRRQRNSPPAQAEVATHADEAGRRS